MTDSGAADATGGDGCVIVEFVSGSNTSSETFTYTGSVQQWVVPAEVQSVTFHLIGAGGGAGRDGNTPRALGGGGGYATGSFQVSAGQAFDVIVGQGGVRQSATEVGALSGATARRNARFGGGASGQGLPQYGYAFGTGGGRSAIRVSGSDDDLVTAGGGGGGGYSTAGGPGGGLVGGSGVGGAGGEGGTQSAGGAGANQSEPGTAGVKYAGGYAGTVTSGTAASEGGGGGGGFYGGGGGGNNGGGGGGSSYVELSTSGSTVAGSGRVPGIVTPRNTVVPVIEGPAEPGGALEATGGAWNISGVSTWQWQSSPDGVSFVDVNGATSSSFVPTESAHYRVVESLTNAVGSASATSNTIEWSAPPTTTTHVASTTTSPSTATSTTTTTIAATSLTTSTSTRTMTMTSTTMTNSPTTTTSPSTATSVPDPLRSYDTTGWARIGDGAGSVVGVPDGGWVRTTATDGAFSLQTSDGLVANISARGRSVEMNDRGMPIFGLGDDFEVSVRGLRPGTDTSTWMFSTPTLLGRGVTDASGNFAASYPIPDGIAPGDHTAQLNGIAPDGSLRSVEVEVEILGDVIEQPSTSGSNSGSASDVGPSTSTGGPEPVTPSFEIGLLASALALMALKNQNRGGSRGDEGDDAEKVDAGGEVATVGSGYDVREREGRRDLFRPPAIGSVDSAVRSAAARLARRAPIISRAVEDGSYLRALIGVGWPLIPLAGAVLGLLAGVDTDFTVLTPAWWIIVSLLVLSCLDALAGLMFALVFAVSVALGGGLDSTTAVRGMLGVAVLSFASPLVAGAVRPFRRASGGDAMVWTRTVDVVLLTVLGAWAAGAMYSALPSLTTFKLPHSERVGTVELVVLVALGVRWLAENAARLAVPSRLAEVENHSFDDPPRWQRVVSVTSRTLLFLFTAVVFLGNTWALWVGGVLFLGPKIVDEFVGRLPNVEWLHRWLPHNLTRTVAMLFVATWWGRLVENTWEDSANFAAIAFVVMGVPGHLLGVADWFGRESRGWPSTLLSKVAGAGVFVTGVMIVKGIISL